MKAYLLLVSIIAICLSAVGQVPKGYHHIVLDSGKIEANLPDQYSVRLDSVYHMNPSSGHDVHTFTFSNRDVRENIIALAYSVHADTPPTLGAFLENVMNNAKANPAFNVLRHDTIRVNGQPCAVVVYTRIETPPTDGRNSNVRNKIEMDYSWMVFTELNEEIYTLNLTFFGLVKPEYATICNEVMNSFKIKK